MTNDNDRTAKGPFALRGAYRRMSKVRKLERDALMLEVMGRLDDLIRHHEVPRQAQGSDTARITGSIEKALERVLAKKDGEGEG